MILTVQSGLLNPLDCPHHMRQTESSTYREGVVLDRPLKQGSKSGSYVDCGLLKVSTVQPLVEAIGSIRYFTGEIANYIAGHEIINFAIERDNV